MYKDLDPILHSQLRLAIISLLIGLEEAEFVYIREKVNTSSGNLSLQLRTLKKAGLITITKGFKGNYPVTVCKITEKGIADFEKYVNDIKQYLHIT